VLTKATDRGDWPEHWPELSDPCFQTPSAASRPYPTSPPGTKAPRRCCPTSTRWHTSPSSRNSCPSSPTPCPSGHPQARRRSQALRTPSRWHPRTRPFPRSHMLEVTPGGHTPPRLVTPRT